MKLKDIAKVVRSKNAGPFALTMDIMFETMEAYQKVKDSKVLGPEVVAGLYAVPVEKVRYFESDAAKAIKFTIPRPRPSGDILDGDIYGAQQHGPLMEIEI